MNRKMKRWGSLLLSLVMALSLLPAPALAAGDVTIDSTNFPDDTFRAVAEGFDSDSDGKLSEAEIAQVTEISCVGQVIESMEGLAFFTALKKLDCSSNQLTTLDVSKNTLLEELDCSENQLTSLNVSGNGALITLNCGVNQLASLDLSGCASLVTLACADNQLTALDLSGNTALVDLDCFDNQLASLDVSKNTALTMLYCGGNKLIALGVSNNLALTELFCGDNQIEKLDVSRNTALKELSCYGNQLKELDVSRNTALRLLSCDGNLFDTLDVSGVPGIRDAVTNGKKEAFDSDCDHYEKDGNELYVSNTVKVLTEPIVRVLNRIEITKPPQKTDYQEGEVFDTAGMVVTATYDDGGSAKVTGYTLSPSGALSSEDKVVTVSYTEGGATRTASQAITVTPSVSGVYTITFDPKGGTISTASASTDSSGKLESLPIPMRDGYSFEGWFVDGEDEKVTLSKVYTKNTTLTAHWTVKEKGSGQQAFVVVFFHPNGGAVSPSRMQVTSGKTLDSLPIPTISSGLFFEGWFTAQTGGTKVSLSKVYTEDTTLYAHWSDESDAPTVYLDANGGGVTPTKIMPAPGEKLSNLPIPHRVGYIFDGWYTAPDGGEEADLSAAFTEDVTFYAHWLSEDPVPRPYTITFNPNGGSVDPASAETDNDGLLSSLPTPTREGCAFEGWYTKATEGEEVDLSRVYNKDTTLYARWSAQETPPGQPEPEPGQEEPTPGQEEPIPGQDTPSDNPFRDVPSGMYYYDPVLWAVNHDPQITNGIGPGVFSPNDTCTRGQVVTFLWRAAGCPAAADDSNPFIDVSEGMYYYDAVLWAVEMGITKGTDPGLFSPDVGCTRGQVVTFLHRFEDRPTPGSEENPFTDVFSGMYYYDAVLWAVNHDPQITKGTSGTTFSPDETCTRGQIVTFLYRDLK